MSNYRSSSDTKSTLTSVGIDIGTTSCHLVFSRLSLVNAAGATQIPKLVIGTRDVLYESPIYLTPLNDDGSIDGVRVSHILKSEYEKAGFKPSDIKCGAVIITGETARLRNAQQVLNEISELAGDFVAASAGPELESILAGRGSGAMQYSKDYHKTICNIDIGGGTTNVAVFKNGLLIETGCLRIGGRCLQFSKQGSLKRISESGKALLAAKGISGESLAERDLQSISTDAANMIFDFVANRKLIPEELMMSETLANQSEIDEYWLSGGVAELIANPPNDPLAFEDLGGFLAFAIDEVFSSNKVAYRVASNPIRATVLGAGSYSLQLSGNTVSISTNRLPLKGIPLVRPFEKLNAFDEIASRLKQVVKPYDQSTVAIVLDFAQRPKYNDLKSWAETLAEALQSTGLGLPYILIVESDTAMALGQLLRGRLKQPEVIVLDGVDLSSGDYIDIGRPFGSGMTIPVTVKSLVFSGEHSS